LKSFGRNTTSFSTGFSSRLYLFLHSRVRYIYRGPTILRWPLRTITISLTSYLNFKIIIIIKQKNYSLNIQHLCFIHPNFWTCIRLQISKILTMKGQSKVDTYNIVHTFTDGHSRTEKIRSIHNVLGLDVINSRKM